MDSLCANYASDDEDGEDQQPGTPQSSLTSSKSVKSSDKPSIFGSLPPPKNSLQSDSREPQPSGEKNEQHTRTATLQDIRDVKPLYEDLEGSKHASSLFGFLPKHQHSRTPSLRSASSSFFDSRNAEGQREMKIEDQTTRESAVGARPSLFSSLPAPKSQPVTETRPVQKQTVTFKPPVNLSVLESKENEEEPLKKKAKPELSRSDGKAVAGLTALLPAPKNSLGLGNALGSGSGPGGRRTAMEIVSTAAEIQEPKPVTDSGVSGPRTPTMVGVPVERERLTSFYNAGAQNQILYSTEQSSSAPQMRDPYATQEVSPSLYMQYDQNSWQYDRRGQAFISESTQTLPNVVKGSGAIEELEDPVARVLRAERRGKEDKRPPPSVIEVKQADLTGGPKLREDQLRTTGIAFGPSYQPTATNKDKPSKLHRRKHQIGSLFYEMKQKEMELMDRRAKGHLSKAETHAKYGW